MWWILLLGTIAACFWLRARVLRLEARLDMLEDLERARRVAEAIETAAPRPAPRRAQAAPPQPMIEMPEPRPEPVLAAAPEPSPAPALPEPAARMFAPAQDSGRRRGPGFEDIFGRYLPIWAGGITLVVAGVLIVKYSIDAGLLSPLVRVIAGLLFGTALIGAAEAALRRPDLVGDRRIGQSLAGAGVATLYAAILVAANLYHLIGPMTAFAGLAGVTVLAGFLSLRYGAPSALLGLAGGLAAPALVEASAPNVPLLLAYLAIIVGGLCALGRTRRWSWLGALAVAGGFIWSALLLSTGTAGAADTLALGIYTLAVAIAFPLLLVGSERRWLQLAAALAGCAQMAAIVANGGYAGLDWALFGLIAAALVWLSRREPLFADAPLVSAATLLLLALYWPAPAPAMLVAVLGGGALIHGGPAMLRLWSANGRLGDAAQIALVAIGIALVPLWHFYETASDALLAGLCLAGAALTGGAAAPGWNKPHRDGDARFAILALTASALTVCGVYLVVPAAAFAPVTAVIALATLLLARRAADRRVEAGALVLAALALIELPFTTGETELMRAAGIPEAPDMLTGTARWLVGAVAAAGFARWSGIAPARIVAAGAAAALGYVAAAQIVPPSLLALIPAATLVALAFVPLRDEALAPPAAVAGLIALAWAALPLLDWFAGASAALVGQPLFVTALPGFPEALARIGATAAGALLLLHRRALPADWRAPAMAVATVLAVIVAHIGWKQIFAIADLQAFAANGMAERTLWELLLLAAAFGARHLEWRRTALGFAIAALAHFGWFTALLHNPLWSVQAAGPWLVPAYAAAAAATLLIVRLADRLEVGRAANWAMMALILLFAASALRQLFHGTMVSIGAVGQSEDIARSLLAILLAVGFLVRGIRRADRDWRIASLVLMLGAVGKVFLFDAAGLDGLLRIASFIALGLSLIGVGWLYSRYLPDERLTRSQDVAE